MLSFSVSKLLKVLCEKAHFAIAHVLLVISGSFSLSGMAQMTVTFLIVIGLGTLMPSHATELLKAPTKVAQRVSEEDQGCWRPII